MLAPVRTVAPASTPVTLAEAKSHLRELSDDFDTLITAQIEAATAHLDGYTGLLGRALVTQTWRQDFCSFGPRVRLPIGPAATITSVTYYDGENEQQTLETSVYGLFSDAIGPYLARKPDQAWPSVYNRDDAVSVTYVAGAQAADVPAPIKAAILLLVGHFFENRSAVSPDNLNEVPMAVDALIAPYRKRVL